MRSQARIEGAGPILQRMREARVAVLGDLVVDEYLYGQTERISREAPVLIVRQEATERKLGGAANAAANLASLGARTFALGAIGDDEAGRSLLSLFEAAGIVPRLATTGGPTETKTRILAGGINTTRQQMLRVDRSREGDLPEAAQAKLIENLRAAAAEVDLLLVSDYGSGALAPRVIEEVRRLAAAGLRVLVDSRYDLGAFAGLYLVKPNEPELAAATGLPVGSHETTLRAGLALRERLGCEAVLVTRGRSGMILIRRGEEPLAIPVYGQEEAVDVTGAGDAVIATLAAALGAGADLPTAARLANVAGGIVVQKPGTATVRPEELLEAVS